MYHKNITGGYYRFLRPIRSSLFDVVIAHFDYIQKIELRKYFTYGIQIVTSVTQCISYRMSELLKFHY